METKEALKKYGFTVLLALLLGGQIVLDNVEDLYYCEARELIEECVRLSSTQKSCYSKLGTRKVCYEGWVKVEGELKIVTDRTQIDTNVKKYQCCSKDRCIPGKC